MEGLEYPSYDEVEDEVHATGSDYTLCMCMSVGNV